MLAWPAVMGFALIYTGEHYLIDVVVGITYVLIIHTAIQAAITVIDNVSPPEPPATRPESPATARGGKPT